MFNKKPNPILVISVIGFNIFFFLVTIFLLVTNEEADVFGGSVLASLFLLNAGLAFSNFKKK